MARRNAEAGALTGADALFAIIKDDTVELAAEVNATDLARLRPGQTALVQLSGQNTALPGTVRRLYPGVDAATRLGKVRISLRASAPLYSGNYGEALLELPAYRAALSLPETAVAYDHAGAASVWLVDDDGQVSRRPVEIGRKQQGRVEIRTGLTAAERVIQRAGAFVSEGDRVSPVPAGDA